MITRNQKTVTERNYEQINIAAEFFNLFFFQGQLPQVLFTHSNSANSRGHFAPQRYKGTEGQVVHEIAIGLNFEETRTDMEILSTLVHELCHLWQEEFGKPSPNGYHNRQWNDKMIECGLQPLFVIKGQIAPGRKSGPSATHTVISGGLFEKAYEALKNTTKYTGIMFQDKYQSAEAVKVKKRKAASKSKFTCTCGNNCWGKPSLRAICAECMTPFLPA